MKYSGSNMDTIPVANNVTTTAIGRRFDLLRHPAMLALIACAILSTLTKELKAISPEEVERLRVESHGPHLTDNDLLKLLVGKELSIDDIKSIANASLQRSDPDFDRMAIIALATISPASISPDLVHGALSLITRADGRSKRNALFLALAIWDHLGSKDQMQLRSVIAHDDVALAAWELCHGSAKTLEANAFHQSPLVRSAVARRIGILLQRIDGKDDKLRVIMNALIFDYDQLTRSNALVSLEATLGEGAEIQFLEAACLDDRQLVTLEEIFQEDSSPEHWELYLHDRTVAVQWWFTRFRELLLDCTDPIIGVTPLSRFVVPPDAMPTIGWRASTILISRDEVRGRAFVEERYSLIGNPELKKELQRVISQSK